MRCSVYSFSRLGGIWNAGTNRYSRTSRTQCTFVLCEGTSSMSWRRPGILCWSSFLRRYHTCNRPSSAANYLRSLSSGSLPEAWLCYTLDMFSVLRLGHMRRIFCRQLQRLGNPQSVCGKQCRFRSVCICDGSFPPFFPAVYGTVSPIVSPCMRCT